MEIDPEYFEGRKEKARALYNAKRTLHNPYLDCEVVLTAKGFHHLQFSAGRERSKEEQLLKFRLLPLAPETIRRAGTLQEYRRFLRPGYSASTASSLIALNPLIRQAST